MKLDAPNPPDSCFMASATSKSVASTGKILVIVLVGVWRRSRVSLYDEAGLLVPPLDDNGAAAGIGGAA